MADLDIDYYELLEVDRGCDDGKLKSAYRKLAMRYHPDKNPGCRESEARFKAINEAYDCLKDPQKRAAYDRFGKAAFQNGGMGNGGGQGFDGFADIFQDIFGEFVGGGRGRGRQQGSRGADLRYDLEITLEEAFTGKEATLTVDVAVGCEPCGGTGAKPGSSAKTCGTCAGHGKVRAQQGFFVIERPCPTCHGAGQVIAEPCTSCRGEGRIDREKVLSVNIPAGVDDGTRIRLSGEGEAGSRGGPAGDLYIFIHLKQHALFERNGTTLLARAPVSFTTAALGGTIEVPGIDRKPCEIQIRPGVQHGNQIRLRGRGMPALNGRGIGDLVVQIEVEMPTKLSPRQKELLEEFRSLETGEECPNSAGFFTKLKGLWEEWTE